MQCKTCGYRLWNLVSRVCPECNAPFVPSDFEFLPNSVQFGCPHCNQTYYGTGENGELQPPAFECVQCRQHIHMNEMILLPAPGVEEDETRLVSPWAERKKIGRFRAWFKMIGGALFAPGQLINKVPIEDPLRQAFHFCTISSWVAVMGIFLFPALMGLFIGASASGGGGSLLVGLGAGLVVGLLGVGFALVLFVAVWGALTQALLHVFGAPTAGIRRTYQALCYSSGANAISGIPFVGYWAGIPWWVVSAIIMVKDGQRVSGFKASVAVLALPLFSIAGVVGFYVWLFMSMASGTGIFSGMGSLDTQLMASTINFYADANQGRSPDHGASLIVQGYLDAGNFVSSTLSNTTTGTIPIGTTNLQAFEELSAEEQQQVLEAEIASWPPATIAYRIGDFVFIDPGTDHSNRDAGLWDLVGCMDPDQNAPGARTPYVHVGKVDGTISAFPIGAFPSELVAQNLLRRESGLPTLPDPLTIRQGSRIAAGTDVDDSATELNNED